MMIVTVPRQRILKVLDQQSSTALNQQSTEMILEVPKSPSGNHGHNGHYRAITLAVLLTLAEPDGLVR